MSKRCEECKLFTCVHIKANNIQTIVAHPPMLPIEPKATAMETFANIATDLAEQSKKVRVELKDNVGGSGIVRRLVPPSEPSKQEKVSLLSLPSSLSDEWLTCNLCKVKVLSIYIGRHLQHHIPEYVAKTSQSSSTALVKKEESSFSPNSLDAIIMAHMNGGGVRDEQDTPPQQKLRAPILAAQEFYKFKNLDVASSVSSVSKDGRYSDFTTTFFFKERTTVNNTSYMGGHSYTTKEAERFTIHVVYDSLEDYYTISSKLLKRNDYSSWDSEDKVPDRICYQSELMSEIKKIMLYFGVPPKTAYKIWRKLFRKDIVIEYDKNNRAIAAQTANYAALKEKLKPDTTIYHNNAHDHDYYGTC